MGYIVRYGDPVPQTVPVKAVRYGALFTVLALLACSAAAGHLIQGKLREALFPWTQESVQTAFAEFREELREGEPFGRSFEDFCREVIADAQKTA